MAYVPVSHEFHRNMCWTRHDSMLFAKMDMVAPIFVNELSDILHTMPIAFSKQGNNFALVGVMGLLPNQNVFITSSGEWAAQYLPAIYRCSPFKLLATAGDNQEKILCIDESCVVDGPEGEPFFYENGDATEATIEIFEKVQKLNAHLLTTQSICAELDEHGLIEPWELTLDSGSGIHNIDGLYKISETNLNNLPDEIFLKLRASYALATAYAQLFSTKKLPELAKLVKPTQDTSNSATSNETFNFSGL